MRYLITLLFVLLIRFTCFAQVMSATQFGLAKVGTGLSVDANGVLSATATGSATPETSVLVTTRTKAGIQALLDGTAWPDGQRFTFYGDYDFSGSQILTITKNVVFEGLNNARFVSTGAGNLMVKIYGITQGLTFRNISFVQNATTNPGGTAGIIYCNEQGSINNLTFDNCYFTCPNTNCNAFGMNAWNGATTTGVFFDKITLRNCVFENIGRMAIEALAHKKDRVFRITNVNIINCQFRNMGLQDTNGMAISLSGDVRFVNVVSPVISQSKLYGIEMINVEDYSIDNPIIESTLSGNGFNITDGGDNEGSISTLTRPKRGFINGGRINVNGRPMQYYYGSSLTVNGGNWSGTFYPSFQHGTDIKLYNINVSIAGSVATGGQFVMFFEDTPNVIMNGGTYSRIGQTAGPYYQPISFDANSGNGIVSNIHVKTSGNSDNYYGGQPYNLNYINTNAPTTKWYNVFWNNVRQDDYPALNDTYSAITYAATVTLDFSAANIQSVSLTGNITFATSNRALTKGKVIRIICDATSRTLTFPSGWVWLGAAAPTTIAAGKTGILSLYSFGTADTDIIASYAVQL